MLKPDQMGNVPKYGRYRKFTRNFEASESCQAICRHLARSHIRDDHKATNSIVSSLGQTVSNGLPVLLPATFDTVYVYSVI